MFISFLPIYLIKSNLSQELALNYVTISLVGGVLTQPLIGYVIDKYNKRAILNVLVFLTFIAPIILHFVLNNFLLSTIFLVIWGGAAAGIFATGLTMVGERFKMSEVASATAIFVMVFESGSVIGPIIGGNAMDLIGPSGFIITISVLTFLFLIIALYHTIRR